MLCICLLKMLNLVDRHETNDERKMKRYHLGEFQSKISGEVLS